MSDDEVIKFEITDHDLESEFNPRRGRRGNKEQQIYGMWAQDSEEEEGTEAPRQRSRRNKDFTAPIGFVAGGVQQAGKKNKQEIAIPSEEDQTKVLQANSSSEEEEQPAEEETAGLRRRGQGRASGLGSGVGNWEKHTKGIGAKLLLQMGYQPGKGLGKALQGISAPVEATVRKGRGAIGAYGPEKAALKAKKEEEKRALKEKEEDDGPQKTYHWKKSHKGRYFYKDASDVIQEGRPTSIHTESSSVLSRVPVIDMTGRERRVLSGYAALHAQAPRFEHEPRRACRHFAAPELMHNVQLVVEGCEQDIINNARELQTAEDQSVTLEREVLELEKKVNEEEADLATVADILADVEKLDNEDITLDDAYQVFSKLKLKHPTEYESFGLGNICESIISPMFAQTLANWEPLEQPGEPVPLFLRWRELLTADAYHSLLWQHFINNMRKAAECWNPRAPAGMVRALSAWNAAAPAWLLRHAAAAVAVPRVASAARAWSPTRDTQPLHVWVLPWHAHAPESMSTEVYPVLRARLAAALAAWHPADASARPLLLPWRAAWGPALTALLHQHIVPKLHLCLQQAPIDVTSGKLEAWSWCADWEELVGAATLAAVAGRSLLPRWLAALAAWLNTGPQHATLITAYTAWKNMFSEDILREPIVKDAFRKALDMMNRSADIGVPAPPRITPEEPRAIADVMASSNQQKSFTELLEARCLERGISLLPMPGRTREGRPLFKIGPTLMCYVMRNVVMYSNDAARTFQPISLEMLLQMAEN